MSEPDYLVGVEEYELAFVEDVLDDSPVDAQTVYKETIEMSPRAIAAEAAYRTTTGGGGAPSGPAGGVLGGTYPNPSFAADMATQAELDAHVDDATAAHEATAIAFTPDGSISATTVQAAIVEVRDEAGGAAPSTVDYLVGTASGGLSAEIVVGTSPGGELGGSWASPTVDATHSGSSHADVQAAAEATAAAALSAHLTDTADAHDASAISIADAGNDFTATDVEGALAELQADHEADATALSDHIADSSAAHAGSAISVSSTTLSGTGTDVQAVLEELDNLLDDHSSRHENGGADEISIAGLDGTPTELTNHLNDTSAAHAASAISADSTTLVGTGTTVQAVFEELDDAIVAAETATSNHLADTSAAHAASAISADSTTLVGTGTDVQAVLEELDNGIADHLADSSAAHAASAISADSTTLVGTGTDVQAVLEELDNSVASLSASAGTPLAAAPSSIRMFSDCLGSSRTEGEPFFHTLSSGTCAALNVPIVGRAGVYRLGTSTSSTARSHYGTYPATMTFGNGEWTAEADILIATLSTSGERFQLMFGFFDTLASIDQADACAFLYDEGGVATNSAGASGDWQMYTASNSTRTLTDTASAVGTGWTKLKIVVNAGGTSAEFFVGGASIGTQTTHIPPGSSLRQFGFGIQIIKSVGSTARTVDVDYIGAECVLTAAR